MNRSPQAQISILDQEIAVLTARKQALQAQVDIPWPKRLTLYAHCSTETNWEKGEGLGLTGEALQLFVHFEEIALEVEVAEDGTVTIQACDGRVVTPREPDRLLQLAHEALAETRSETADDVRLFIGQALVVLESTRGKGDGRDTY